MLRPPSTEGWGHLESGSNGKGDSSVSKPVDYVVVQANCKKEHGFVTAITSVPRFQFPGECKPQGVVYTLSLENLTMGDIFPHIESKRKWGMWVKHFIATLGVVVGVWTGVALWKRAGGTRLGKPWGPLPLSDFMMEYRNNIQFCPLYIFLFLNRFSKFITSDLDGITLTTPRIVFKLEYYLFLNWLWMVISLLGSLTYSTPRNLDFFFFLFLILLALGEIHYHWDACVTLSLLAGTFPQSALS